MLYAVFAHQRAPPSKCESTCKNALPFHITVFHLRSCEFTYTQKCSKSSGLHQWLSSRLHSEDSKPPRTPPLAFVLSASGTVFLCNFIFSFNDQRGAVKLTTDARQSDNLKRTPAASRTILFSDQRSILSFKPAVSITRVLFPVSSYVALASCNSRDYLVECETGLVGRFTTPRDQHDGFNGFVETCIGVKRILTFIYLVKNITHT